MVTKQPWHLPRISNSTIFGDGGLHRQPDGGYAIAILYS
jgi:hypothetical protein